MVMQVLEILSNLRSTGVYKEWRTHNKNAKPVHIFILLEPNVPVQYDIGFYDDATEQMHTFSADEKLATVAVRKDDEVFKQDDTKIHPLEENRVKLSFQDACEKCRALQKDKYCKNMPLKEVVILQNLDIGQVWNITYVTMDFKTLNMKVDAETGEILEDKLHEIFSFDK
jgi:hypothetical protein